MSSPWWAAFGPAKTQIACGNDKHLIRWADGRLEAVSHPDAEGELVMAALGGETPRCLALVQAWGAHRDDLEVLAIGPRSAADLVPAVMPGDDDELPHPAWGSRFASYGSWPGARGQALFQSAVMSGRRRALGWSQAIARPARIAGSRPMIPARRRAMGGFVRSHRAMRAGFGIRGLDAGMDRAMARQTELRMLFALGTEFQWRLSGAVAAAWSAAEPGHDRQAAGPALTAALTGRLAPVASEWLGADPERVEVTVHDGGGWGTLATRGAGHELDLRAALPTDWLARVWAPGLALVDGRLVVAVQEAAWPRARVLALAEPGAEPVPADVEFGAGQWHPAHD